MQIKFSNDENEIISICKTRHDNGLKCRSCEYKEKCARFFEKVNQNYNMLKEIIIIWKNQQSTEQ